VRHPAEGDVCTQKPAATVVSVGVNENTVMVGRSEKSAKKRAKKLLLKRTRADGLSSDVCNKRLSLMERRPKASHDVNPEDFFTNATLMYDPAMRFDVTRSVTVSNWVIVNGVSNTSWSGCVTVKELESEV